ncbi:dipeptidyl aminopeptidase/acylaminoacyl peptidase [Variovorax sp. TBS-050B]|uniref:S9 family peptidase n=1 Tax=Variovorax sp. TBS-050B TaxID=2940551 RepID=UPI002476D57E|nr:S9 family peptidase [Variovorax sp. TBS-050B]MDH6590812.1 dipeptidyl aminopeptidase/acylaminoacyl peptidase [Variovorax sp. TBS-050B]
MTSTRTLTALALAALLAGCAVAPTHPALQGEALPPLIPVREFVANTEGTSLYRVSPDGAWLAWKGVSGLKPAVWVKRLANGEARPIAVRAQSIVWSGDSRFLFLTVDPSGDEDTKVLAVDVARGGSEAVDLTPFKGARSRLVRRIDGSAEVLVASNARDKKVFDLYRIDPATGTRSLIAQNPGNVAGWVADRDGRLRARSVQEGDGGYLQLPDGDGWRTTLRWQRENWWIADLVPGTNTAWAVSSRGRDKEALVRMDLETGAEQVIHAEPEVDVEQVLVSRRSHAPLAAYSMPGHPRARYFDAALAARLEPLAGGAPAAVHVSSMSDDEQILTVSVGTDRGWKYYLLTGTGKAPELLGESNTSGLAASLASTRPIAYEARDGLRIHGYLTLPPGVQPRALPMVLLVHGGPWARDLWTYQGTNRSVQQFLANRGYAVLQVNYRGSSGYGRAFMEKAVGEFAGRMHDDLIDGVRWAVAEGVADPARVAIYGASYGGYSALVGATMTPETFACAVDVVGMSDLARLIENAPAYWALGLPWWKRYVGDPADPAQRKVMDAKSPINHVAKVRAPLLVMHGVNDPRVKFDQSERMVAALRAAGKPVEFVSFRGDGHGNQKWSNNLAMYRHAEDFLAGCLGGRSSGFDYYQLGAWAF